ncbi:MAG TPA: exodeoxyribonuclease III [Xanthomonadaceae bacterium]|nr:exodeoxyribonuclease III [Xanthomonadaceae bacterium]
MRIASWNVNSLKVRLPHLESWVCAQRPDIVALQETKLTDEHFPVDALKALGYHAVYSGQKTYNGVAILSREPAQDVAAGIPGFQDDQKRVLAATIGGLRVVDLYVVNGQEVGSEKFAYKLRWLAAVHEWLRVEIARHPRLVVLGDFNIAPEDRDVHDPKRWREKILCSTPEREALQRLLGLGLHDSLRLHSDAGGQYSWWDYRLAAYQRGWGLRIDLVLLGEALCAACSGAGIDIAPREWERPSDHAPVWVELDA